MYNFNDKRFSSAIKSKGFLNMISFGHNNIHAMNKLVIIIISSLLFVNAQDPPDFFPCVTQYEEILQANPIGPGTCDCAGHLWVAPGCAEGYICFDVNGWGCHIVC